MSIKERINKSRALKYILIIAGTVVIGSALSFSWWKGFKTGCSETADESVKYIKENYPDAYKLITQQGSQSN